MTQKRFPSTRLSSAIFPQPIVQFQVFYLDGMNDKFLAKVTLNNVNYFKYKYFLNFKIFSN